MMRQVSAIGPFKQLAKETDLRLQNDQIIEKKTNNILRAISHESGQYD